jgi:hypothetical protein
MLARSHSASPILGKYAYFGRLLTAMAGPDLCPKQIRLLKESKVDTLLSVPSAETYSVDKTKPYKIAITNPQNPAASRLLTV